MAIAHMHIKAYSRKSGPQVHGKAAYDSADKLMAPDGTMRDFSKKTGVVFAKLFCDDPSITRQNFWDAVEASEKRKDACTGRGYDISLPLELDQNQQIDLAKDFALHLKNKFNLTGIDVAIHHPTERKKNAQSKENPHIHILHPDRDRTGKKLKFSRNSSLTKELRSDWENFANKALEKAGRPERIYMGKLEEQLDKLNQEAKICDKQIAIIKRHLHTIALAKIMARKIIKKRKQDSQQYAISCTNNKKETFKKTITGFCSNGTKTESNPTTITGFCTNGRKLISSSSQPTGFCTNNTIMTQKPITGFCSNNTKIESAPTTITCFHSNGKTPEPTITNTTRLYIQNTMKNEENNEKPNSSSQRTQKHHDYMEQDNREKQENTPRQNFQKLF